jgi:hypothetical protein
VPEPEPCSGALFYAYQAAAISSTKPAATSTIVPGLRPTVNLIIKVKKAAKAAANKQEIDFFRNLRYNLYRKEGKRRTTMTVEQIIKECEMDMKIADINMEAALAEGEEQEAEFWNGRRLAFGKILHFIRANGEG